MDLLAKRVVARFQASREKRALLTDGPIGRVLDKVWNNVHDIEYDLEHTLKDYDDAAHFMGGPAQHDAQAMIKKIQAAVKELENVSKKTFNDLAEAEADFVKKHGEPSEYADQMRKKTFPRAAAANPRAEVMAVMAKLLEEGIHKIGKDEFKQILEAARYGVFREDGGDKERLLKIKQIQNGIVHGAWRIAGLAKHGKPTELPMSQEAAEWFYKQTDAVQYTMSRQLLEQEAKKLGIRLDSTKLIK